MNEFLLNTLDATLRYSTPLIFASMAGLFSERSGVVDIGLEGKMLTAAFAAATGSYFFGSEWLGLVLAIMACVSLSMLHGFASVTHKGDQVVSCVAINILMIGLTTALAAAWFGEAGLTPTLNNDQRFLEITLPFADALRSVPVIGLIYSDILNYIDTYKPYDKAGSYGIQDSFSVHINKITGCFYNVMGLPISKFHRNFILAKKEINNS